MFKKARKAILELLRQDERWWYGLDLVQASGRRLKRGSIYIHLSWLIDDGLVESRKENDEEFKPSHSRLPRRSLYKITQAGIQAYADMS
jgi:DNA-binding PadR family transcriptional regulator